MSEHSTVHVSGIASGTSEKEVQDFFSFCGKITTISATPVSSEPNAPKSASVTFEKDAAAKTALLLDQTQLGTSVVTVKAGQNFDDITGSQTPKAATDTKEENHNIEQEDKPRSRIVAEYLAHGYALSDNAVQSAIALDQKHGFSSRFTQALGNFDQKYQASDRARGLDENYKLSDKAWGGWHGLHSYFEKALGTPSGRKLRDFYSQTDKQVREVHSEARRLADLKNGKGETEAESVPTTASGAQGPGGIASEATPASQTTGGVGTEATSASQPTGNAAAPAAPTEPKS